MDRWIYVTVSRRKESDFENLKTRFQDCNLSRKQESKPDGMIERKLSVNLYGWDEIKMYHNNSVLQ